MLGLELGEREGQHLGLGDAKFAAFPSSDRVGADAESLSQLSLTEAEGEALGLEVDHLGYRLSQRHQNAVVDESLYCAFGQVLSRFRENWPDNLGHNVGLRGRIVVDGDVPSCPRQFHLSSPFPTLILYPPYRFVKGFGQLFSSYFRGLKCAS